MKKKRFLLLMIVCLVLSMFPAAFAEGTPEERYHTELNAFRFIYNIPTAFEAESFAAYSKAAKALRNMDCSSLNEKDLAKLEKIEDARAALVQIASPEEVIWEIWGQNMPVATDKANLVFDDKSFDNEDFRPFLVPYLVNDQNEAKGNIIVVAGGGYSQRANDGEGYNVAECFRNLGYNCYVLQRRVAPYAKEDIWLDMQRAVRYLRSRAQEFDLGGMDCVVGMGFSGGSGTVLGAVQYCYGDVQPTVFDPDYVPDAVDAYHSDMDAVCALYGPNVQMYAEYNGMETENQNLPEMFVAAGQLDNTGAGKDSLKLVQSVFDKTKVEFHLFADARHGFSLGLGNNNASCWVQMADAFLGRLGNDR